MILTIKNLGPIKTGQIDLSKSFYLFVGYNNSGKTYMAQLLWGLFEEEYMFRFTESIKDRIDEFLPEKQYTELELEEEFLRNLLDEYIIYIKNKAIIDIFNLYKNSNSSFIINNLNLELTINQDTFDTLKETEFSWYISNKKITITKQSNSFKLTIESKEIELNNLNLKEQIILKKQILVILLHSFFSATPFYLPASRIFYPSFFKYIYETEREERNNILEKLKEIVEPNGEVAVGDLEDILLAHKGRYTEPMNRLIKLIFHSDINKETSKEYTEYIKTLNKLLGGEIIFKQVEGIGVPEFYFRINGDINKELSMYLASSMINQLSTLYLFFKYWARTKGGDFHNFLIVDEPEENLHPQMQMELIKLLVKFHRDGNRVLLTTHSPLVAEAINNHLYLGMLKKEGIDIANIIEKEDLSLDPEIYLDREELGVYFFDGEVIKAYDAQEYGVLFRDFNKAKNNVEHNSYVLANHIFELEEEN